MHKDSVAKCKSPIIKSIEELRYLINHYLPYDHKLLTEKGYDSVDFQAINALASLKQVENYVNRAFIELTDAE